MKPWQYRSWIFPQDPDFLAKAGRVFDLYQGRWQEKLLHPGDCVICADEKPSIQARLREHQIRRRSRARAANTSSTAKAPMRAHLPGRARHQARPLVRPFRAAGRDRPLPLARPAGMSKEPYASARRVFGLVDNGSAHRGQRSIERLERRCQPRPRPPPAARELAEPVRDLRAPRGAMRKERRDVSDSHPCRL